MRAKKRIACAQKSISLTQCFVLTSELNFRIEACEGESAIAQVKAIADVLRNQLGFINANAFSDSARRQELLVARDQGGNIVGFTRFHHRRDRITTLYEIGVTERKRGVARP